MALIKTEILAKGGSYVAVMTLSDIADTPFGNSAEVAPARSVLTALSQNFNLWLRDGLTGQPVQIIDTFALFKDGYQNPAKYGIVNNTTPACDVAKIQAITGGARHRRHLAVLQCHAGRAVQRPRHRRRRQHLAVRGQRPSDDRRPQDHQRCVRGPAARVRLDLTPRNEATSMKTISSLVVAAALAGGALAAQAQDNVFKIGVTRYDTHAKTNGIDGIGVPPGADAKVGDATTVDPRLRAAVRAELRRRAGDGHPADDQDQGEPAASSSSTPPAPCSRSRTGRRRCSSTTTSSSPARPGGRMSASASTTRKFKNAKSSIADDVEVGSSWGPAVQVGIDYAITKDISAFASLAAVKVKSKVVASGATVLTTTVDYRPTVYSVGVAYKF